jgi:hypothetical protein
MPLVLFFNAHTMHTKSIKHKKCGENILKIIASVPDPVCLVEGPKTMFVLIDLKAAA